MLKIFSATTQDELEGIVNNWLSKEDAIDVKSISYAQCNQSSYGLAIYYERSVLTL